MTVRRSIVAAGAAVAIGATGALALPAAASAHNASHTLKFTTVTVKHINFSNTSFADQETDINSTGKTIGFDVAYITITGKNSATVNVAFGAMGGLLYATASTTNMGKTFSGTVTGGTGEFKGTTGTITGKTVSSTKTAVTIVYS